MLLQKTMYITYQHSEPEQENIALNNNSEKPKTLYTIHNKANNIVKSEGHHNSRGHYVQHYKQFLWWTQSINQSIQTGSMFGEGVPEGGEQARSPSLLKTGSNYKNQNFLWLENCGDTPSNKQHESPDSRVTVTFLSSLTPSFLHVFYILLKNTECTSWHGLFSSRLLHPDTLLLKHNIFHSFYD